MIEELDRSLENKAEELKRIEKKKEGKNE